MFNGVDFDNNQFIYRLRCRFCGTSGCRKSSIVIKNGVSSVACFVGFASLQSQLFVPLHRATALCGCHYASLHSGFVWLTASILAWSRGGSPSNIAPSHGEGVWGFGKDAEIERPKALQDAKPTKRSYRDREFALFL